MKRYLTESLFIILVSILLLGFNYRRQQNRMMTESEQYEDFEPEIKKAWGFAVDSVSIDTAYIKPDQSLSDILQAKGISPSAVEQIAQSSMSVFDVRRLKAGNAYYLISKDSSTTVNAMIYEESAIDYVVFNLDSSFVYRGQKNVDTLTQTTSGIIESSLWNAFVDNGASPILAVELADIFAWTVDFFGIQKGDEFKVIYDALFVDGEYAGIGKIHAANFVNMGITISAYYFNQNNQQGFFDDEGNSLRKAFLKAPLSFSRISSRYSNGRYHPILKIARPHRGVDYAAPTGTPVYSIGDGVVVKKAYQGGGGGNYINIKHNSVYTSQYMHLSRYAKGMAPGVRVKQGQVIGYVGMTGIATGPHLDFRIYKNGAAVDPLKVKAPPIEPINELNKKIFTELRDSLKQQLNKIDLKLPMAPLAVAD